MKYPITAGVLVLIGLLVIGKTVYGLVKQEACPTAVEFSIPKKDASTTARFQKETTDFAQNAGYRFMDSTLNGTLTLFGPSNDDRRIVNFNAVGESIDVSFYDCRKGGNGADVGYEWFNSIASRYR